MKLITILILSIILASGCINQGKNSINENLTVTDINILILESFPVQVNVAVKGNFLDACSEIYEVKKIREGNEFFVTIITSQHITTVCEPGITSFEKTIPLYVHGLRAGKYIVNVNGVTSAFELQTDNFITPSQCNDPDTAAVFFCDDDSIKVMSRNIGTGFTIIRPDNSEVDCPTVAEPAWECVNTLNICSDDNICE